MGACTSNRDIDFGKNRQDQYFVNSTRKTQYLDYPKDTNKSSQLKSTKLEDGQIMFKGTYRSDILQLPEAKLFEGSGYDLVETEVSQLAHKRSSQKFDKDRPSNQTEFIETTRFDAMTSLEIRNSLQQFKQK